MKYVTIVSILSLIIAPLFGACFVPESIGSLTSCSTIFNDGHQSLNALFWVQGEGNMAQGSGIDWGTGNWENRFFYPDACGTNTDGFYSDWISYFNDGDRTDGCPTINDRVVFLMEYGQDEGTTSHQGFFTLASVGFSNSAGGWNIDDVGNTMFPQSYPVPVIDSVSLTHGSVYSVRLHLQAPDNPFGYYDEFPGYPLITGYAIYYITGKKAPVSSKVMDGWILEEEIPDLNQTETTITIPRPKRGEKVFLAMNYIFDTTMNGAVVGRHVPLKDHNDHF